MDYYRRDGTPSSREEWTQTFENDDRHVGSDIVGLLQVSTVFLGLNHNYGDGPPLIFETMVFSRDPDSEASDLWCERYSTEEEALAGHQAVVESIKNNTFCDYNGDLIDSTYVIAEEPTLI